MRITAGDRLKSTGTARSAFPAVGLDLVGSRLDGGKTGSNWRDFGSTWLSSWACCPESWGGAIQRGGSRGPRSMNTRGSPSSPAIICAPTWCSRFVRAARFGQDWTLQGVPAEVEESDLSSVVLPPSWMGQTRHRLGLSRGGRSDRIVRHHGVASPLSAPILIEVEGGDFVACSVTSRTNPQDVEPTGWPNGYVARAGTTS